MCRLFSLTLAVCFVLVTTCSIHADDMASGIVKYFAGKWESKSADGTPLGSVNWKAVAGGKAIGGPGMATPGGAGFALAGWDAAKKVWFHVWYNEDGQHGRLEVMRFQDSTYYGKLQRIEGNGEVTSSKWENKIIDEDHFMVTERSGNDVTISHWHRVNK